MTGWLLSHRFVSDLIVSSNATRTVAWANYYRFFNRYKWSLDHVCEKYARLVVRVLVPADAVIMPSVDDTLYHKRGLSLFGVGMHHDARLSSKRVTIFSWAHSWVIVTGLQWAPPLAFSLPICFRLYHNKQGGTKGKAKQQASSKPKKKRGKHAKVPSEHLDIWTRPELAVELLKLIAGWFPDRQFVLTGDSLYGGRSVASHLPSSMNLISRAPLTTALYALHGPPTGCRGRRRKKGDRLPTTEAWATDTQHDADDQGQRILSVNGSKEL
jgi:hypothetical protein